MFEWKIAPFEMKKPNFVGRIGVGFVLVLPPSDKERHFAWGLWDLPLASDASLAWGEPLAQVACQMCQLGVFDAFELDFEDALASDASLEALPLYQ